MFSLAPPERGIVCSKIVFLVFNVGLFAAGLVLVTVGLWCVIGMGKDILNAISPIPDAPPTLVHISYGMIGVGGLVLVVATLGTWAAVKESKCGLGIYLLFVTLVISSEVTLAILAVVYEAKATNELSKSLKTRLQENYAMPNHDPFTIAIDYMQYQLFCCGVDGPEDWLESRWKTDNAGGPNRMVPLTCCTLRSTSQAYLNPAPLNESLCQGNDTESNIFARHSQGCVKRVQRWIKGESTIITGVGVGIALLQLAGLIASASLCRALGGFPAQRDAFSSRSSSRSKRSPSPRDAAHFRGASPGSGSPQSDVITKTNLRSLYRIHDSRDRGSTRSASSFYPYQPVRTKSASVPESLNNHPSEHTQCGKSHGKKTLPAFYHCSCSCRHLDNRKTRRQRPNTTVEHNCCDYYAARSSSLPRSVDKVFELTKKERILDNWIPYSMAMMATPEQGEPSHRVGGGRRDEMEENVPTKRKRVHRARPVRGRLKRFTPVESLAHRTRVTPSPEPRAIKPIRSVQRPHPGDAPPLERNKEESCLSRLKGIHRNLYSSSAKDLPSDGKYRHCWQTLQESSSTSHTRSTKTSPPPVSLQKEPSSTASSEDDSIRIQNSRVKFLRQKFENIESESDKRRVKKETTRL